MRGFKDNYKGTKTKERKNRPSYKDDIMFTLFEKYRKAPVFLYEDYEFNIDAELEADFVAEA